MHDAHAVQLAQPKGDVQCNPLAVSLPPAESHTVSSTLAHQLRITSAAGCERSIGRAIASPWHQCERVRRQGSRSNVAGSLQYLNKPSLSALRARRKSPPAMNFRDIHKSPGVVGNADAIHLRDNVRWMSRMPIDC